MAHIANAMGANLPSYGPSGDYTPIAGLRAG
jgi:hypothetical protein